MAKGVRIDLYVFYVLENYSDPEDVMTMIINQEIKTILSRY